RERGPRTSAKSSNQQATVQHAVNKMLRPALGNFQVALNHLAASLAEYNGNGVGTILTNVTTTEIVPNDSGLAGSGDVAVSEITSMVSSITTFLTTYNAAANQNSYAHWASGSNVFYQ